MVFLQFWVVSLNFTTLPSQRPLLSAPMMGKKKTELTSAHFSLGLEVAYFLPLLVLWPELSLQPHPNYRGTPWYLRTLSFKQLKRKLRDLKQEVLSMKSVEWL